MKKIFFFLFVLVHLLTSIDGRSQAPGYQGNKLGIYYNACIFPGFTGPFYTKKMNQYYQPGLNVSHMLDFDYIYHRDRAFGTSFRLSYSAENMIFKNIVLELHNGNGTSLENNYYINFRSMMFGVYLKFFNFKRNGSIAPLGQYDRIEIAGVVNKPVSGKLTEDIDIDYEGDFTFDHLELMHSTPALLFLYSHGLQTLYFNKMFVNIALQLGFQPNVFKYWATALRGEPLTFENNQDIANLRMNNRVAAKMMLGINIGFGFLPTLNKH